MKKKAAFLDVDKVISKDYWLIDLVFFLIAIKKFDFQCAKKILENLFGYLNHQGKEDKEGFDYLTVAKEITNNFAKGLKGQEKSEIEYWSNFLFNLIKNDKYYDYTKELIEILENQGFEIVLLTASPMEIIQFVAQDLKVPQIFSLECAVENIAADDKKYSGKIVLDSGNEGVKKECVLKYAEDNDIDLARSIAIGDGLTDAEMMEVVGLGIALNADDEMADLALKNSWPIIQAGKDKVIEKIHNIINALSKYKILFVCKANMFRSPVAEQYFKIKSQEMKIEQSFAVKSAGIKGTGGTAQPDYDQFAKFPHDGPIGTEILAEFGIDISKHFYQPITSELVDWAHTIIAMSSDLISGKSNSLVNQFPQAEGKTKLFSDISVNKKEEIVDPYQKGEQEYRNCVLQIIRCIDLFFADLPKIMQNHQTK